MEHEGGDTVANPESSNTGNSATGNFNKANSFSEYLHIHCTIGPNICD